jgi:hypothetical protein
VADKQDDPATLTVPHRRASDYREIWADGLLHRFELPFVILTICQSDRVVIREHFALATPSNDQPAIYRPTGVDEEQQRLDLCAIRIPVQVLLDAADGLRAKLEAAGLVIGSSNADNTKDR